MRPEATKPWWKSQSSWDKQLLSETLRRKSQDSFRASMRSVQIDATKAALAREREWAAETQRFADGAASGIRGLRVEDEIQTGAITFENGETTELSDRERMLMASVVITLRTS